MTSWAAKLEREPLGPDEVIWLRRTRLRRHSFMRSTLMVLLSLCLLGAVPWFLSHQLEPSQEREGRVLSARLIGSSGDPVLDAEGQSMLRRASPVPAPPEGYGGGSISLTVPIKFNR